MIDAEVIKSPLGQLYAQAFRGGAAELWKITDNDAERFRLLPHDEIVIGDAGTHDEYCRVASVE